ncbi:MAG: Protein TolB [Gammaproteobacteria bacterium]|nr:Protein TolB [Gammaproteobacteria bacterium]
MALSVLLPWGCARVAFVSERDGRAQIYRLSAGGALQTNISDNGFVDHYPDVSPDATRVVFSSLRNGPGENIYVMATDGTGVTALTSGSGQRVMPRWGANDRIAFQYPAFHGNARIWSMNGDGSDPRQLTSPGTHESDDGGHDFYGAGAMLVFSRYDKTTQRRVLYTLPADGGITPARITTTQNVSETLPVVSHDGARLAYREFNHTSLVDRIRVLNVADWSLAGEIAPPPPVDRNISGLDFAAGDERLYFSVQTADVTANPVNIRQEVFSIALDGSDLRRLTDNTAGDTWPVAISALTQQPAVAARIPVLFVHGHSGDAAGAWQQPAGTGTTSFAAALQANPSLAIDPFYLQLPVHGEGHPESAARGIAEDATDILAAIEGGADSAGTARTGILEMPAYQGVDRVAIVGYSQGAISSRYYLKNLMGARRDGAVTVSEFIALAAPNHGAGGAFTCGTEDQPDRSSRELCAGRTATIASQLADCGSCGFFEPDEFSTNLAGDNTFLTALNGHGNFQTTPDGDGFAENCPGGTVADPAAEAPHSRPTQPDGVLYVNLYAAGNADLIVGGGTQSGDCLGRRLARNHAPDAANVEVTGVPAEVHSNFPHHWPTICMALYAIGNHAPPADQAAACDALNAP